MKLMHFLKMIKKQLKIIICRRKKTRNQLVNLFMNFYISMFTSLIPPIWLSILKRKGMNQFS